MKWPDGFETLYEASFTWPNPHYDPDAPVMEWIEDQLPMTLIVTKTDARAKLPTRGSEKAAGLDLYSIETRTLRPGKMHLFKLGIRIELPAGCEGQIRPRSGLALKHCVTVLNAPGTVDEDYRGEMGVMLINHGLLPVLITEGDRIAQLVVSRVHHTTVVEGTIDETVRGADGFGSSGK